MQLDDCLDDRQPQTQAAVGAGRGGVGLAEALEQEGEQIGLDADAGVVDHDLDVRVDALEEDVDGSAFGREFDRVGQEVPHDLLQPRWVARDWPGVRVDDFAKLDLLGVRRGADGIDSEVDDACQVGALHVESNFAGDDAAHVQQVVDELRLRAGVALDGVDALAEVLGRELVQAQELRPAEDGIERGAQLVRQRGEKLVLHDAGVLGLGARGAFGLQQLSALVGKLA